MEWKHWLNWFEIPSNNFDRAVQFYREILKQELKVEDFHGIKMAVFPHEKQKQLSGAIVFGEQFKPSSSGVVIYLNGGNDLSQILSRVEQAGGKVLMPKTFLQEEIGYIGLFSDSEGNTIGLHSVG